MEILKLGRLPIKSWASEIEEGALAQAVNLSNLPFAFSHIAIMPDVHEGYGMPIGGILATEGVVIPNAVGVDIGCGLVAIQTGRETMKPGEVKKILKETKRLVPVGFKHHKRPQEWDGFAGAPEMYILEQEINSAKHQLGTLGGGNHFASIEQGDDGFVWLMVHTGSRNLGFKVANYFNKTAKKLNEKEKLIPKEYDLAYLPLEARDGREYFEAMTFCLEFSKANRFKILERFFDAFKQVTASGQYRQIVDIHHNYAAREKHFGKEVIVHRKGATKAEFNQYGIIPGSMGTSSFIVKGLGNPQSFNSSSHGAGRVMSRKEANRLINREEANKSMKGIVFDDWRGDLSEAPMAYKDIDAVMALQKDLVQPIVRLNPLGVMKG